MKKVLFVATVDSHIRHFHIPYLKYFHDKGYEVHVATSDDEGGDKEPDSPTDPSSSAFEPWMRNQALKGIESLLLDQSDSTSSDSTTIKVRIIVKDQKIKVLINDMKKLVNEYEVPDTYDLTGKLGLRNQGLSKVVISDLKITKPNL